VSTVSASIAAADAAQAAARSLLGGEEEMSRSASEGTAGDSRTNAAWPRGILLDLDETILTYPTVADTCWQTICRRFCSRVRGTSAEVLFAAIWEHRDWYWSDAERLYWGRLHLEKARQEIVAGGLRRLGVDDLLLADEIARAYALLREEGVAPFPGAIETLRALGEREIRLALVTNGPADLQESKIATHGLAALFDAVLISGKLGYGKPDERIFRLALDRLQVTPRDAWMVGDNLEWDVVAAQRLGILGIWVDALGQGLPPSSTGRPDRIIRTLPELL
jgi:putative hydrolase of the HAD superfamily